MKEVENHALGIKRLLSHEAAMWGLGEGPGIINSTICAADAQVELQHIPVQCIP